VDHYLAKDMLQNILHFRFKNNLFEKIWNAENVASIAIRTWETLGVEHRGGFYDPLGALRDVGQNHLFEMLALVTMERPKDGDPNDVRAKRADAIKALRVYSEKEAARHTFRAQYEGYRNIKGVRPDSDTETYYRVVAFLDLPRWKGVPVTMEAGKRLHEWRTEVVVSLKDTANKFVFRTRPKEEILIYFESKKPGILEGGSEERALSFSLHENEKQQQYVAEYARMILDAIAGDRTLFVGTDEVSAAWRFIDPIIAAWKKNLVPLVFYKPDTNEAVRLAEEKLK
jgi:glucose-6-phosphate 1-dehydrogenase